MRSQSQLVILLVVIVAAIGHTLPSDNDHKIDEKDNEIEKTSEEIKKLFKPDPKIPKAMDPRFNKMLPLPKVNQLETATKPEKVQKSQKTTATEKAVKDETSTLGKQKSTRGSDSKRDHKLSIFFIISAASLQRLFHTKMTNWRATC